MSVAATTWAALIRRRAGSWALLACNALIGLFLVAPLAVIVISSFNSEQYLTFVIKGVTLRWYAALSRDQAIIAAFLFSLRLAVLATVASVLLGLPLSIVLHRGRSALLGAVQAVALSPLVIPGVVTGLALLLFYSNSGLVGGLPLLLGAHVCLTIPFVVRIVTAGLAGVDRSIDEFAMSLGASRPVATLTITLPLIRSSVFSAAAFAFLTSFDEVVVTVFIAPPGSPTLPVYIFDYIQYNSSTTIAAAAALMATGGSLAAWLCSRRVGLGGLL